MSYRLDRFEDFHLHGASAPEWDQTYLQMTRGRMHSALDEATADGMHVFRKWMSERVVQQGCLPDGQICFGVLGRQGAGTPWFQGKELGVNGLLVLRGREEFLLQRPRGMELLSLTLDAERFMERVEAWPLPVRVQPLLGGAILQAPEQAVARFRGALLKSVRDHRPEAPGHGVLQGWPAPDRIVEALIEVLASATAGRQKLASSSASYIVGRCHRLLAEAGESPPSIEALSARLKVSRRTLQNSFRDVAGMPPLQYLRCVRLARVRDDLLSTRASDLTVSQAALKSGFVHFGRFAENYKELFGELPSRTRRSTDARRGAVDIDDA